MNKILISAALGAVLLMPSAAFALDNLNSFFLSGQTLNPATMTCAEFNAAAPELQALVSAWFDGDATMNDQTELHYSRSDLLDLQAKFREHCAATPNQRLADLKIAYGGTENDYINVTCDLFNKITEVNEAGNLLAWVTGYYGYSLDDTSLDGSALVRMGNEIITACAAAPNEQLAKYVYVNLNLGTAADFEGGYDWNDDGGNYGNSNIQLSLPDYYYEKNIAN